MSGSRVFVIGDIHGCVDEIDSLLDAIAPDPSDKVIFLGDYIDRGPSPKGVIERLLRLRTEGPQCVFLRGNHEDMFLSFLGLEGNYGDAFLRNGGATTLQSYGMSESGDAALELLPAAHRGFLEGLELMHRHERFLCVHAGLHPERSIEAQRREDLLWIRDEWLPSRHPYPYTVLFGHTPMRTPLVDLPYKIGLDTGLVYSNRLSCLELTDLSLFQIRRGERVVSQFPLASLTAGNAALTRRRRPST